VSINTEASTNLEIPLKGVVPTQHRNPLKLRLRLRIARISFVCVLVVLGCFGI